MYMHSCYIHVHVQYLLPSEPSEVSLVVDGETDQCSRGEDINFNHVGFSVYGQVNKGHYSTQVPSCICYAVTLCALVYNYVMIVS